MEKYCWSYNWSDDFLKKLQEKKKKTSKPIRKVDDKFLEEVKLIIESLYTFNNRKAGREYLKSKHFKRVELEVIVKVLDIPNQGTIEKLIDSIIERTIGFRLRSKAIQG